MKHSKRGQSDMIFFWLFLLFAHLATRGNHRTINIESIDGRAQEAVLNVQLPPSLYTKWPDAYILLDYLFFYFFICVPQSRLLLYYYSILKSSCNMFANMLANMIEAKLVTPNRSQIVYFVWIVSEYQNSWLTLTGLFLFFFLTNIFLLRSGRGLWNARKGV